MYYIVSSKLKVILVILVLSLVITQVKGQSAPEVVVGTTTIKPTIDGQWQPGEWDDAIAYKLSQGLTGPVKIQGFFRMTHDTNSLFGIVDVPSDNGSDYVNANGDLTAGAVFLAFYYGALLNPNNQTQLFTFFAFSINRATRLASVAVMCRPGMCQDPDLISSKSDVASALSTTRHSNSRHRVWEFSIPIHPDVIKASFDTNPAIGFDITAIDSSGNQLSLVNLNQHASMTFVTTPVPEIPSGQMTLPLVLATPLTLLFLYYRKRDK